MNSDELTCDGRSVMLGEQKLAMVLASGALQMMPGKKAYRETVLAFLGSADPPADPVPAESPPSESAATPPAGHPSMGDKDPKVIAWWFANRPAEAAAKYRDRRFADRDRYFPR